MQRGGLQATEGGIIIMTSQAQLDTAAARRAAVTEDYEDLIRTGETHAEAIARRLRFPSVSTMERSLYRNGITIRHDYGSIDRPSRAS